MISADVWKETALDASAYISKLLKEKAAMQDKLDQVDDVLIVNWIAPPTDGDYRRALNDLISFNIEIERYRPPILVDESDDLWDEGY